MMNANPEIRIVH